jgi:anti-sigma factor RsiW
MSVVCRVVQAVAPSQGDGLLSVRLNGHVSTCLACQAEIARYGKLRRQLAALADVMVAAPEPLAAAVAAAIASSPGDLRSAATTGQIGRIAAAGGAVAAAAAGAVAVALWRNSRPVAR